MEKARPKMRSQTSLFSFSKIATALSFLPQRRFYRLKFENRNFKSKQTCLQRKQAPTQEDNLSCLPGTSQLTDRQKHNWTSECNSLRLSRVESLSTHKPSADRDGGIRKESCLLTIKMAHGELRSHGKSPSLRPHFDTPTPS